MKVFLIDNNKIIKYMLPLRVDDSYLISYNSSNIKDCLITFVGENDSWYLKSNGTVNIVENNQEVDKVLNSMGLSRIEIGNELNKGDKVKILDGPFKAMYGKVEEIDLENQSLTVLIDLFGQETPVDVNLVQIEKA